MELKKAILAVMNRDTLKAVADDLEFDGVDRRSREDMASAYGLRYLSGNRAVPREVLPA